MARRKGTWERTVYKHGFFWWLLIGWWWRPIAWFTSTFFATLFGYARVETTVMRRK